MLKHTKLAVLFSVTIISSCGPATPSEDLKKATEMYSQTVELEIETRSILGSLEQVLARDSARAAFAPRVEALSKSLTEWESRVVSAGGGVSDHLGHQHRPGEGIPDAQMLQLQTQLNAELAEISNGLLGLMDEMSR